MFEEDFKTQVNESFEFHFETDLLNRRIHKRFPITNTHTTIIIFI